MAKQPKTPLWNLMPKVLQATNYFVTLFVKKQRNKTKNTMTCSKSMRTFRKKLKGLKKTATRGANSNPAPRKTKRNLQTSQGKIGPKAIKTVETEIAVAAALEAAAVETATAKNKPQADATREKHPTTIPTKRNQESTKTIVDPDDDQDRGKELQVPAPTGRTGRKMRPLPPVWICCRPQEKHPA